MANQILESNFYSDDTRKTNDQQLTLSVWFKYPANDPTDYQALLTRQHAYGLYLLKKQLVAFCFKLGSTGESLSLVYDIPDTSIEFNAVFTLSGQTATLYVNGTSVESSSNFLVDSILGYTYYGGSDNLSLDTNTRGAVTQQFQGEIDRISIFSNCLQLSDIKKIYRRGIQNSLLDLKKDGNLVDIKGSEITIPGQIFPYNLPEILPAGGPSAYPFDINLVNQKDGISAAIYILSDINRTLDLQNIIISIENKEPESYQVESFTLSFRKGTLNSAILGNNFSSMLSGAIQKTFALTTSPAITKSDDANNDNFLVELPQNNLFTIEGKQSYKISLSGVYAEPGAGTRTTAFSIQFNTVNKSGSKSTFSFGRTEVIQIINHQGNTSVPVRFGVLGNNFLLNNNENAQSFGIYLQTIDGKELALSKDSKIIFSLFAESDNNPVGMDGSIAFGNSSEVMGVNVTMDGSLTANVEKGTIAPNGQIDFTLLPNINSILFQTFSFSNVFPGGYSGEVKVHIAMQNIPGYWDSTFAVTLIKGPMVQVGSKVGINTLPPSTNQGFQKYRAFLGSMQIDYAIKDLYWGGKLVGNECPISYNLLDSGNLIPMSTPEVGYVIYINIIEQINVVNADGKDHSAEFNTQNNANWVNVQTKSGYAISTDSNGKITSITNLLDSSEAATETNAFHINGNTYIDGNIILKSVKDIGLNIEGNSLISGSLGIGVSSATESLEVLGSIKTQQTLIISRNDPNAVIQFIPPSEISGNEWWIGAMQKASTLANEGSFIFYNTSNQALMVIAPDGKLGIGNNNPQKELDVNGAANVSSDLSVGGRISDKTGEIMPVGSVIAYAGSTAPTGWLLCNGQSFTKFGHETLFNLLCNDPNATETNVPDLSGKFILGEGNGHNLNDSGGLEKVILTKDELPKHDHMESWLYYSEGGTSDGFKPGGDYQNWESVRGPSGQNSEIIISVGNDQPHENMPPYYVLTYIIKY